MSSEIVCGSLIHFPPAACSRPIGHGGEHTTAEIPAPLSAVAARMVTASDELDAERDRLEQYSAHLSGQLERRIRHLRYAALALGALSCVVVVIGVYVIAAATLAGL